MNYLLSIGFFVLTSVGFATPLKTVDYVDLDRYQGLWYEIARLPQRFQKDCVRSTAEYNIRPDGLVRVYNTCYREDQSTRSIEGVAKVVNTQTNAQLKVKFDIWIFKIFGWLIAGDYWVLDLAPDYSHAMVGAPDRKYLWILARTQQMDKQVLDELISKANALGFDTRELIFDR